MDYTVPILFLFFNREAEAMSSFRQIRKIRPSKLYLASDGPRSSEENEGLIVDSIRRKIEEQIDWECDVKTLYKSKNEGCMMAVSDAISWFFKHESEGIILEDDCVPHLSFFEFMRVNLERYRDDSRVWMISGFNFKSTWKDDQYDHFYSRFGSIWGWATWRRCWKDYRVSLHEFDEVELEEAYLNTFFNIHLHSKFQTKLDQIRSGYIDTWDYQWEFLRLINHGLSVVSSVNLIENIGFGELATHTRDSRDPRKMIKSINKSKFDRIPKHLTADRIFDLDMHKASLFQRFKNVVKSKMN